MKKFTFMLIAAIFAVAGYAQKPLVKAEKYAKTTNEVRLMQNAGILKAPQQLTQKLMASTRAHAQKKAAVAADYVGDYTWDYEMSSETSTDLESLNTSSYSTHVTIAQSTTEGSITISGMFSNDLEATIESDEYGDYFKISGGSAAGTSSYGDYVIYGLFYYEGDEEAEAGWYYDNIYGYLQEDGTIAIYPWICRVLTGGQYDGYSLTPYYVVGSTLTPAEPLAVVTPPEGAVIEEYSMFYSETSGGSASAAVPVKIAVVDNDVYVQGFSYYIPEAWVKGTKDGETVTFPAMQYVGEAYDMTSYAFYGGDAVFTYDEKNDIYTAKGEIFGVLGDQYYDGRYFDPVIKKVVEKAAMPANPAITDLKNGQYGWYFLFNVPVVDVDGEPLATSKLYYMIYTDTEHEVAPLTFTPATHTRLTEDMTEFPYGFTESYDFYNDQIYLNDLYSENWNKIGIQSIYTGGGELNATEIQWYDIKDYALVNGSFTFNFNEMDVPTSSNVTTDGDIIEIIDLIEGEVTLTISPKDESATTPNRFWSTNAGPQLRMYSGTMTFSVPSTYVITEIKFNHNGKWGANTVNGVEIPNDATNKVATWTPAEGEEPASEVVVAIAANTQMNSIEVAVEKVGGEVEGDTYTFDDGTLQGWTTIDADGDGYNWMNTSEASANLSAHNGSQYAVFSQSYANQTALNPDNYLVSPQVQLGGKFSFFAVAQDASYPEEHFGVFVSTKSNTDPADFVMVEEWTLTKVRHNQRSNAPRKVQGKWYQYIVDLSDYEGQEGYVAIRHFDCTDMFYMLVDDITFGEPADPDPEPEPEELVELPEGVEPIEYTLDATGATSQSTISIEETMNVAFDGTDVYLQGLAYYFPEAYVKGTLTANNQVIVPTGQFVGEDEYGVEYIVALGVDEEGNFINEESIVFNYDAETGVISLAEGTYYGESGTKDASGLWDYFETAVYTPGALVLPDPVVAPEDLETETWYLSCDSYNGKIRAREVQLGVSPTSDGSDMYIQGLCEYLPEAWVKGTIDKENNTVTFASGQFYGLYEDQYRLFFVGYDSDTQEIADVVFSLNVEDQTMTTDQWIILNGKQNDISYYDYYTDVVISKEMPELPEVIVAPEDLVTETYYFEGFDTYYEEDVTKNVQIGFYGENEVYMQGLSGYTTDAWVKGTIENGVVTIPETYLGLYQSWFGESEVYFSGTTFVYDAEADKFTSQEGFVTYETPDDESMMDEFINVVLTKLSDVAATPADPEIAEIIITDTTYPRIKFNIPSVDVNGNPLVQSKLAYQLFIEKAGVATPLVLTTDLYEELEEDMSEIPYGFSDGWDIYTSTVYLNQGEEEISSWKKIGIQSIYYGGGECNKSNIVWEDLTGTGIASLLQNANESTIYNIAGQRVQKTQKGIFIVNGKKVVIK